MSGVIRDLTAHEREVLGFLAERRFAGAERLQSQLAHLTVVDDVLVGVDCAA